MDQDYYWPHPDSVRALNQLLNLPATGHEQDWEIELSDPERLDEMVGLFCGGELDLENRSALALLMIFSLDPWGADAGTADVERVQLALQSDPAVHDRMRSYWSRSEENGPVIARLTS
jgi:hypothetical protein